MALQWNENLAVGVGVIDDQQREIVRWLNNLLNAMDQGKGKEKVSEVLAFLANYAVKLHMESYKE